MAFSIRTTRKFQFAAFLFLLLTTHPLYAFDASTKPVDLQQTLQNVLESGLAAYHIPGGVMALRTPKGTIFHCQAGYADLKEYRPMTPDLFF